VIQLYDAWLGRLGITDYRLELNSIGDRKCRPAYIESLTRWLDDHDSELDDETRAKRVTSPLRAFDNFEAKPARVRTALSEAPKIGESLCNECREHFASVRALLDAYGVAYELVPTLVRGLDYYTRTTWEFVGPALGAQSTLSGGGRYDYLVEEIGGPPTPGVGFGAGIERLLLALEEAGVEIEAEGIDVFFGYDEGVDRPALLAQMAELRRAGWRCDAEYAGRSKKGQRTQAKRLKARFFVEADANGATITLSEGRADASPVPVGKLARRLLELGAS